MGVWLVVGAAPMARPRPGPMLLNKVAEYCYYIPNAPELISERVRIQGASPHTPALTNPPRFARLIPYILTTTIYLVLDL